MAQPRDESSWVGQHWWNEPLTYLPFRKKTLTWVIRIVWTHSLISLTWRCWRCLYGLSNHSPARKRRETPFTRVLSSSAHLLRFIFSEVCPGERPISQWERSLRKNLKVAIIAHRFMRDLESCPQHAESISSTDGMAVASRFYLFLKPLALKDPLLLKSY